MKFYIYFSLAGLVLTMNTFAQSPERKDVPLKYQWNLSDIYASEDQWMAEKSSIRNNLGELSKFKGHLGDNAETLSKALTLYFSTLKQFYRLSDYSARLSDENLKIAKNQSLNEMASALGAEFSEKTSFISPEILRIDQNRIQGFFKERKDLAEFSMFVDDIQRLKKHTLTEAEEKILASFRLTSDTPSNVYNIFTNAEMPYPKVKIGDKENVELSAASYTRYRSSENRSERENIFREFFTGYSRFQNALGANLAGKVKTDYVYARNRNYASTLEYGLSGANIPVTVYENLINQIHNNLPTLHRFLNLKKKMLGVDTLHYYDLYTPIVKQVKMNYTIEEGQKVILEALKPMGDEYLGTLKKAFEGRWIDFMPTPGKLSGAYSSGASYDVHPFILTNWTDDYESVSTLAHELGHSMHSYLSNKNQP
ncbi:MAG: M3 family oligoendopeptidase, partial [Ignavibacteriales bacterium]